MNKKFIVKSSSWLLSAVVISLAVIAWANQRLSGSSSLTAYDLFPLLGLSAFSLMWTHYIAGMIRRLLGVDKAVNQTYFLVTSIVVLALILLHPGLLIGQLWRDGFGLPPGSYLQVYSAPSMKFAILLGTISLLIFLLFELKRRLQHKSWWQLVEYAQVLAMFLIFYHGLSLGRELDVEWYRFIWYGYGVSLAFAVSYNYWYDKGAQGGEHGTKSQSSKVN